MKHKLVFGLLYFWFGSVLLGGISPAYADNDAQEEDQPQATHADSILQARKHLSFGATYLRNKQYEDAETQFLRSWSYNPKRGQTAYHLGKLYNKTEKYDEAVTWFKKTLELAPKSGNAKNAWYYLSQIHLMNESRPEAIQAFEALLEFSPEKERELLYLHHLVSLYVEEGDYETALNYARKWGELEPDSPDVQDTIAKLALSTGEEDEALSKMEEVIAMTPDDYATLERLADMYRKRGQRQKAFGAYEKLYARTPGNFLYLDYLYTLGTDLGKSRNFQIGILKKMYKLQPGNLRVAELLADKTGDIFMINKGLKLDPRNGKLCYMKGDYYYKKWKSSSSKKDSTYALNWFGKAKSDPQWRSNAQRMIDEINPPLTKEEKLKLKFFQKKKDEEVDTKGKK